MADLKLNDLHPIRLGAETALDDLISWREFGTCIKTEAVRGLIKGAKHLDPILTPEFATGALPRHFSNGAAERALKEVEEVIGQRAFCLRNAPRTELMLELVRLRLNRTDDELTYSKDIRAYIEAGGVLTKRMTIRDKKDRPSLRPYLVVLSPHNHTVGNSSYLYLGIPRRC